MSGLDKSRWSTVAAFTVVASANQMMWLNFAPITSGVAHHYHVSQSDIGMLSELFPLLYVVLALPVGRALDRWFRHTLAVGAILTAGGAVLRIVGHGFGWVAAGQVIIAFGQPAIVSAITGTSSRYLAHRHRALGISLASAGTFLGFIEAFALGGALGASRVHTILVISAVYALVSAVWLVASLSRPLPESGVEIAAGFETAASAGVIKQLWSDGVLRNMTAMVFVGFGVFIALSTWAETLLKPSGVSSGHTDTLLVVMVVAGVAGCAIIPPAVADRGWQPGVIAMSAVVMAAGATLLAVVPGLPAGAIALPLIGLLLLPDLPVVLELAERRAGNFGGTATSMLWLSGNAGGIAVALIVQGLQGSPGAAFGAMAVLGLVALPLAGLLRRQLASERFTPAAPGA